MARYGGRSMTATETFTLPDEAVEQVEEIVDSDPKMENKSQFYRFAVRQQLQMEQGSNA